VYPRKDFGHRTRLVSLKAPDEVPGEFATGQRFNLGQAFLQEILAEVLDPRAGGAADCCAALTLGNGQKRDRIDIPGGRHAGLGDATLHAYDGVRAILRLG
jgi:hypothetical protein